MEQMVGNERRFQMKLPKFFKKDKEVTKDMNTELDSRKWEAMKKLRDAETPEEKAKWAELLRTYYQTEIAKNASEQKKSWFESETVRVLLAGGFGTLQILLILYGEDVGGKIMNGRVAQYIMKLRNRV